MKHLRYFIIVTIVTILTVLSSFSLADSVIHTDEMFAPRGMYYDEKNGRIVFVDYDANAVFELNVKTFKVKKIAGKDLGKNAYGMPVGGYRDGKAEEALFKHPSDVVVLSTGAIVVADTGNHAIRQIFEGKVTTIAGGKQEGKADGVRQIAEFSYPSGIAVSGGVIYVADTENNAIRKILSSGKVETLKVHINKPSGIDVVNRDIYVTSMEDHAVYHLKNETTLTLLGKSKSGKTVNEGYVDGRLNIATFSVPSDVLKYKEQIYIVDAGNHAVRRIQQVKNVKGDKFEVVQTIVGGKIGFSDEKEKRLLLDTPRSVVLVDNRLYVADTNNGRILMFDNASRLAPIAEYERCNDPKTVHIYVDGTKIEPDDIAPVLVKGLTYVPVRLLTESIGGEVKWLSDERAVLCKYGDKELKISKDRYILRSNRAMVPLRYIAEHYGLKIEWNKKYRAVIINTY